MKGILLRCVGDGGIKEKGVWEKQRLVEAEWPETSAVTWQLEGGQGE